MHGKCWRTCCTLWLVCVLCSLCLQLCVRLSTTRRDSVMSQVWNRLWRQGCQPVCDGCQTWCQNGNGCAGKVDCWQLWSVWSIMCHVYWRISAVVLANTIFLLVHLHSAQTHTCCRNSLSIMHLVCWLLAEASECAEYLLVLTDASVELWVFS